MSIVSIKQAETRYYPENKGIKIFISAKSEDQDPETMLKLGRGDWDQIMEHMRYHFRADKVMIHLE